MAWGKRAGVEDLLARLQQPATAKSLYVLSTRQLSEADACRLAHTIAANTQLEELYLSGHRLGAEALQAFADCLAQNRTLQHLCVGQESLGDAAVETLCAGLARNAHSALRIWDLEYKSLGVAGAAAVGGLLASNATLETLTLSRNQVGDAGVREIVAGLRGNPQAALKELQLTDAGVSGAALDLLAPLLTLPSCSLQTLQLSFNALESATSAFFDALASNTSLRKLQLKQCQLSDAHVAALGAALQHNKALLDVDLSDNALSPASCAALADGLARNATLTTLRLGNNACHDAGATLLADVLAHRNTTLTYLELSNNGLSGAGVTPLLAARGVKELHVFNNALGDAVRELLPALAANVVLETLDVGANQLHGELSVLLFDALHAHPSLSTLEMGGNSLGEQGHEALDRLKAANRSLDVAVDKNAQDEDGNFGQQA